MEAQTSKRDQEQVWLNTIRNTFLLFNTIKDLGQHIQYPSLVNNDFSKMGNNFYRRATFRELSNEVSMQTNETVSLQDILENYEKAVAFYLKYKNEFKNFQESDLFDLLDFVYNKQDANRNLEKRKFKLYEQVYNTKEDIQYIDVPILLLIIKKTLPPYTPSYERNKKNKGGESPNTEINIKEDYAAIIDFLRTYVQRNKRFIELPILNKFSKDIEKDSALNRIYLIYATFSILETFKNLTSEKSSFAANKYLNSQSTDFDLNGIWSEYDDPGISTEFWEFEELYDGNYFLYKYHIDNQERKVTYIRYEAFFYIEYGETMLCITTPSIGKTLILKKKVESNEIGWMICKPSLWDDEVKMAKPYKIELKPSIIEGEWFKVKQLNRIQSECKLAQTITKCIGTYTKINLYPEYDYEISGNLFALTQEYIYIKSDDNNTTYRIPKSLNEALYTFEIYDSAGVAKYQKNTYIAFPLIPLYVEITTEEQMKQNNIEIIKLPTLFK